MSVARGLMNHRALLERQHAPAQVDAYGHHAAPLGWETQQDSMPCKLWSKVIHQVIDGNKIVVVEDLRAIVPTGTDITERDRLNGVTDRRGRSIRAGILLVRGVQYKPGHIEVVLEAVQ